MGRILFLLKSATDPIVMMIPSACADVSVGVMADKSFVLIIRYTPTGCIGFKALCSAETAQHIRDDFSLGDGIFRLDTYKDLVFEKSSL